MPQSLGSVEEQASGLDPLGLYRLLPELHRLNAAGDVHGLVSLLRTLTAKDADVAMLSPPGCLATMRDLGLLLGSIRACDVEPVDAVPEVQPVLVALGERTDMVPRDTLHHYVACNPSDERERTYTGDLMERLLISAVRTVLPRLNAAATECERLAGLSPAEPEFAIRLNEVVTLVRSIEDAIDFTTANVTPEYFARTMRRYFEPIQVAGVTYLGPAAAHAPLYLVDLALWAGDCAELEYREFWQESAVYGIPRWRELCRRWAHGPSVATQVAAALTPTGQGQSSPHALAAAEALARGLRSLLVFRGKHLSLARQAYRTSVRRFPVGSGGASVALLTHVTDLTRDNAVVVNRLRGGGRGRARNGEEHS